MEKGGSHSSSWDAEEYVWDPVTLQAAGRDRGAVPLRDSDDYEAGANQGASASAADPNAASFTSGSDEAQATCTSHLGGSPQGLVCQVRVALRGAKPQYTEHSALRVPCPCVLSTF